MNWRMNHGEMANNSSGAWNLINTAPGFYFRLWVDFFHKIGPDEALVQNKREGEKAKPLSLLLTFRT